MNTLLIDTSNQPMSIALMKDEEVLAAKLLIKNKPLSSINAWNSGYLLNAI